MRLPNVSPITGDDQRSGEELAKGLWNRIGRLQTRIQRLVWLDALSSLTSALVLIFFFGALLDWWIRPTSMWGRGAVFLLILSAILATFGWFARNRRRKRISRLAVARRLEAVFPAMGDRLSSAVAILESRRQTGEPLGSDQLADAALLQAAVELDRMQPENRVDWRSTAKSIAIASLMVGMVLLFCFWRPAGASLVAQRLFAPNMDAQWPRQHQLVLENVPEQVYSGETLEIFVRNAIGALPNDTELLFRSGDAEIVPAPLRITGEAAVGQFEVGRLDVDVRAVGGDDRSMPWQRIKVVDAPSITSYRLMLTPPGYTGLAPVEVAETQFKVLSGTRMDLAAELTLPVESAELVLKSRGQAEVSTAAQASALGTELVTENVELTFSGEFLFRWTDANGLVGESDRRWQVIVDEDSIPRVVLQRPEADTELTQQANLEIQGQANDDLGFVQSWLEVQHVQTATLGRVSARQWSEGENDVLLQWSGTVPELFESIIQSETAANDAKPETTIQAGVGLEGTTFEITAVAIDSAGQRGQSITRRLRVISSQAMRQAIARQQSEAMRRLMDARTQQEIALEQTEAARTRVGDSAEQLQAAADRVQAAAATQQAVARDVAESTSSAAAQLRSAIDAAEQNGLPNNGLRELSEAVEQIARDPLPAAEDALKNAAESLAKGSSTDSRQQLESAAEAQQDALRQLEDLVQSMRQDDTERAVTDELSELAAAQTRLTQQARAAAEANNPDAERERLAQKQRELARSTDQLVEQLQDLADELSAEASDSPDAERRAEQARAAADALQQGPPDGAEAGSDPTQTLPPNSAANAMRQAAEELGRGREGRAENLQREVQEQLEEARRQMNGAASPGDTLPQANENDAQTFSVGVQQALRRQSLLVEQLKNEPSMTPETLGEEQANIAELTKKSAADPQAPPGFDAALDDAAKDMQTAAALLRRNSERESAEETATAARERLRFVVESLLSEPTNAAEQPDDSSADQQNAEEPEDAQQVEQRGVPTETLKLLRATQEFIRTRTEEVVSRRADTDPLAIDPVRASRLQAMQRQLADEQSRLVERIGKLVQANAGQENAGQENER